MTESQEKISRASPIMKVMGNLHYFHKFAVISILFIFAILFSLFFTVTAKIATIQQASLSASGNNYLNALQTVTEGVIRHKALVAQYQSGKESVKNEIIALQSQINADFRTLIHKDTDLEKQLNTTIAGFQENDTPNIKPEELERSWTALVRTTFSSSPEQNLTRHLTLIDELHQLFQYVGSSSSILLSDEKQVYYLANSVVNTLPQSQMILARLTNFGSVNETISLAAQFRMTLNQTKESINSSYSKGNSSVQSYLREPLRQYLNVSNDYLTFIYRFAITGEEFNLAEARSLGNKTINDSFALWHSASEKLDTVLEEQISTAKFQLYWRSALVILMGLVASLFGFHVLSEAMRPISTLMKATKELADGNLATRVPVIYNDTVGMLSQQINTVAESFQQLIGQLQWTGIQLTTSTTQIAAAAKQQEATVIQQEATTKEIAVTAREISATAKDFAKTMSEVSGTAEQTSSLASSGKEALDQMQTIMHQLVDASTSISSKLGALNEKAGTITGVVTTITKVADQTNLLSLNAAIEAEKAGEHGRSFAVIAREIRRLADQTANATYDIEKMVTEMVSAVSAGVMGVDKFSAEINNAVEQVNTVSEHLAQIIEQVQQQTASFESVNQGMQAQSLGAEQINESIIQLSEVAQQTADSIRQFHRAVEQLNNAAQEMQNSVVKLHQ